MADPQGYERDYSFSDYQSNNPSQPLPGPQVDNELENIEQAISGLVGAVKDVRRSDGKLKNEIVTMDSLHPIVKAGVGQGAVETLEQAHEAAQAAAQSASAAASSAGAAAGSAGTAATSAGQAMGFRNAAQTARDLADTARTGAQTARDFAAQWASAPEGQIVDDGLNEPDHSAYHYAQVALGAAEGNLPDGSVTTSKIADEAVTEEKLAPEVAVKLNRDTADELFDEDLGKSPEQRAQALANIGAVSHDAQSLTAAQQVQARENIGLDGMQPYFGPVAGPTRLNANFSAVNKQMNSYQSFRLKTACKAMTLAFPNWYVDNNYVEVPAGAAATITASIEYPIGVFTKVTFNSGTNSGSIPDGGTLLSDAIPVDMPTGAFFRVRTYVTCAAGVVYSDAPGEAVPGQSGNEQAASGSADKTMSGAAIADSANVYAPIAILGGTDAPSIALHGDSRTWGAGDSADGSQDAGNLQRSLSNRFSIVNLARAGDRATKFLDGYARRKAIADYCSHVTVEYGINDLRAGARTAAQLKADNEAIIALYAGKPVFITTLEPSSTSTDSYATLANQTTHASNSQRVTYNGSVRAGLAGAAGYFELADVVESSRDSGKWKVTGAASGYTADGVHATRDGYLLVPESNAIDQRAFLPALPMLQFASMKQMQLGKANNLLVSPALVFGEQGEFTPTLVGATTAGTCTYTTRKGFYRKMGNLVFFQLYLSWSGHTGTGAIVIEGLPFSVGPAGRGTMPFSIQHANLSYTEGRQIIPASPTSIPKTIRLYQAGNGAAATEVPMDPSALVFVAGTYFTDD